MNEILSVIPDPDTLPVSSFWFNLLSYLTYYLHLVSTGIMFGISTQVITGFFRGRNDMRWRSFADTMSRILPFSIAFTVNLGIAPLLFLQALYGNFFYTASIVIGIPWILLIPLLIISYYSIYWVVFKKNNFTKHKLTLSIIASIIFAWIAFILVNINTLMMVPQNWKIYYSSKSGMNLNISEPTLVTRYIFYLFVFMLIGGTFTSLFYKIKNKKEESNKGFHFGSIVAAYFSFLSIPAFILFLHKLPAEIKDGLLKGNIVWTVLAILFVLLLCLIGFLNFKRKTILSCILLGIDLVLFVLIRNHIRYLYLNPFRDKFSAVARTTQYDVMILFFVVLILGLGLVIWLLRKTAKEHREFKG